MRADEQQHDDGDDDVEEEQAQMKSCTQASQWQASTMPQRLIQFPGVHEEVGDVRDAVGLWGSTLLASAATRHPPSTPT